jgi:hypothetical protein
LCMKDQTEIIKQYLAEIGRKGGLSKSEKKAAAVRENGRKGGRPRKDKSEKKARAHNGRL